MSPQKNKFLAGLPPLAGDVAPCRWRGLPPLRGSLDEPGLDEIRLMDVLDRAAVLADGDGNGLQAHRPAPELVDDRVQDPPVHLVEAEVVDTEHREGLVRDLAGDHAVTPHKCIVPNPPEEPVRNPGSAPAPLCDLERTPGRMGIFMIPALLVTISASSSVL